MKNFIKLFVVVCLFATTCVLASCEKKSYDGTLTVATNCEFAPFEFVDGSGNKVGIDMDIAKEIASMLNYELVIKDMAFDSVIGAIEAKQANIAMAGLTISESRKESVDFCDPYFDAQQVVIGKTNSAAVTATSYDDVVAALAGKKIGFQTGTVGQYFVEGDEGWGYEGITGATPTGFTSGAAAVMALNNGQIDYIIIDKVPALQFEAKNTQIKVNTSVYLTEEQYAFAVQKGDTVLAEKINDCLKQLKENGKFAEIVDKYYSDNN